MRARYEQNIPQVYEILRQGSQQARATAAATLDEVRSAMRINYFNDTDLISSQSALYTTR